MEEIPFGNIASVHLVTRTAKDVFGEAAEDSEARAKIVHIDLRNPEHKGTRLDYHFMRWSQKTHNTDVALVDSLFPMPIKTVYKKIKKRWQQWQEGPGREEDDRQYRAAKLPPRPWYQKPVVVVPCVLGIVALCGLGCLLIALLKSKTPPVAAGPNPKQQQPLVDRPNLPAQQPVVEGPNPGQQQPGKAAVEKLNPQSIPGLLAYWPLDEAQGRLTHDKSGVLPASLKGGEWIQGAKGAAVQLNGTSDFVDLRSDARLNFAPGAAFTLAGWVATAADQGVICSFRKTKGFGVIGVLVIKGNLLGWVRDDTSGFGGVRLQGGPIKDGKWHHFALVRQADGTVELFLDAQFQGKDKGKSSGGPITTDLRALGSDRFVVANRQKGPAYLDGSIDEVCLYDRVLTPAEIGALAGKKE